MKQKLLCTLLSLLMVCSGIFCCAPCAFAEEQPTAASAASGEVTVYEQDFESISEVSKFTDLGWKQTFNGDRITTALKTDAKTGNHYLEATDKGWSCLEIVPYQAIEGATAYTVSMKVTLNRVGTAFTGGSTTGIFGFIYNNATPTNQNNGGMLVIRNNGNDSNVYLANAGKRNNTYYCASFDGEGTEQWRGKWAKLSSFLSIDSVKDIPLDLSFTVDQKAKSCTVFVNGKLVNICNSENFVTDHGGINLLLQNQTSQIDDIKVTCRYENNMEIYGHQRTVVAESVYGLRFIAAIRDISGYTAVGMEIKATDESGKIYTFGGAEKRSTTVYRSITGTTDGKTVTYNSQECRGNYLYCATLSNIPKSIGKITYEITPFAVTAKGETVLFPVSTIVYNGAEPAAD